MNQSYLFYVVDDDPVSVRLLTRILRSRNHQVFSSTSSKQALKEIPSARPDCILLDIMMPEMDGLQMCKQLRSNPQLDAVKIVMVTSKHYESDRRQAYASGANGYIVKPVDPERLPDQLTRIVQDSIEMIFWGVRGTLPVPGKRAARYGGNTSCVSLSLTRGNLFIFDAGTGIKELSDRLMAEAQGQCNAKIFISHPHWDHINALPFFAPLYIQGNEFEILGPSQGEVTIRDVISGQMDGVHFPIQLKEFGSTLSFRDLTEESFDIDGIRIQTMLLNHPGHCLGYRVQYKSRSVCYITDNELLPKSSPHYDSSYVDKLIRFVDGSDALITDTTYADSEYPGKTFWGHSSVSSVADLAHQANVRQLFLFHHDPDQNDGHVDLKLKTARAVLRKKKSRTRCIAPKEKQVFWI